jgi:hypothetical protein
MALFLAGADGVMCADVALAVRARADAMDRWRNPSDKSAVGTGGGTDG